MPTTLAATSVGANTATLNGNVTANGLATNAWFEWGTDPTLASSTSTSSQPIGSGITNQSFNASVIGLSTGTTYYYRIAASNSSGTIKGDIVSFIPGAAPTVTTSAASSITYTGAVLNGDVNPDGYSTNGWFEYGSSSLLSTYSTTPVQAMGAGSSTLGFHALISGLNSYQTYYFRAAASNSGGTQKGAIRSFQTGEYYVAVGDSITFGYGDDILWDGVGYEPILANFLAASKGYPIIVANEGVAGVDSAYGAASISATLSNYPSAKYYLVMYGTNDSTILRPSGVGLIPVDVGYSGTYKEYMQQMITAILSAGKTPYLAKVPYYTASIPGGIQSIQEYNLVIEELVAANGVSVTPPDFYAWFQSHQSELAAEGVHPNGTGYQSMANLWYNALP